MAGGYVMNIQDFSVNDGEGIRTNIFLAGCPLTCAWCSNPEGQTLQNAMTSYMTVEEVTDKVKKQMIFYRMSGGGVTFSGGEATVQQEFLRCLAGRLYDMGISLAIETCGQFAFEEVKDILGKMDLIFYDIKHMDAGKHRIFTGISNEKILSNVSKTARLGIPLIIRVPVIHGVNTDGGNLERTFAFVKKEAPLAKLELLPYHTFGEGKYAELGMPLPPASFQTPSQGEIEAWNEAARKVGIETISYR